MGMATIQMAMQTVKDESMKKEEVLKEVLNWSSGLPIEGETKAELKDSLKSVQWSLECELNQEARNLELLIDRLDIPDE